MTSVIQFELPQKAQWFAVSKQFDNPNLTEYLNYDVIGHRNDSDASDALSDSQPSVTESEQKLPAGYVLSETGVASRLLPKMRMLRRVLQVLPHAVVIVDGYHVKYHVETLECGHELTVYEPNFGAKRRNCSACVNARKANQSVRCRHCGLWACVCFERSRA